VPTNSATKRGLRLGVQLIRNRNLLEFAVFHHCDPIGHGQGLFLVVGDEQRRDAKPLQRPDLLSRLQADLRVERGQRLVEQQHLRLDRVTLISPASPMPDSVIVQPGESAHSPLENPVNPHIHLGHKRSSVGCARNREEFAAGTAWAKSLPRKIAEMRRGKLFVKR